MPKKKFTLASINVNGIRAAHRKGFIDWLKANPVDVLALQEVRATYEQFEPLLADLLGENYPEDGWQIFNDEATKKGYAGVALFSKLPVTDVRYGIGPDDFDSAGRWLEADLDVGGETVTVVSCYIHSGEVGTERQVEKYRFLDAMIERLPELEKMNPRTVVAGDLNVGHTTLDIKNWKGNVKKSGFLPEERAYFDRFFGERGATLTLADETTGTGLGWVDIGRKWHGEVEGPYTWWSMRGQAFDNDTGWRIDYHAATPELAKSAVDYQVHRAPTYDQRWTDHSPVVVEYDLEA